MFESNGGRRLMMTSIRESVTVKKVLLRKVVFIKLEVKKATRVDLTIQ